MNTVDHLGSVTYKVNDMLDENVEEVTETEFHVSCIEQVVFFFLHSHACLLEFNYDHLKIIDDRKSKLSY